MNKAKKKKENVIYGSLYKEVHKTVPLSLCSLQLGEEK
jgi:hypothetical protein